MSGRVGDSLIKHKVYSKTVWVREEVHRELKRMVEEGLFMNLSEAMRTGIIIVILLSKINPEALKVFRELTEELRRLNKNLEKIPVRQSFLNNIWRFTIEV